MKNTNLGLNLGFIPIDELVNVELSKLPYLFRALYESRIPYEFMGHCGKCSVMLSHDECSKSKCPIYLMVLRDEGMIYNFLYLYEMLYRTRNYKYEMVWINSNFERCSKKFKTINDANRYMGKLRKAEHGLVRLLEIVRTN